MDRFLDDGWVAALDGALRTLETSGAPATVEIHVDGPDGATVHHLRLGPGPIRAATGPATDPDVVVRLDASTALAIGSGELAPRTALADGRLTLSGDPGALAEHLDALVGRAADPTGSADPAASDPG